MVDRETLDRRLARLEQLLTSLRGLAQEPLERFLASRELQAQAERWLHLAAECALDIAHHVIADSGWRTPGTYRESFEVLQQQGVLSEELATKMVRWAGLRNVLVHLYLDVDHEVLHAILRDDLADLAELAAAVARFLDG